MCRPRKNTLKDPESQGLPGQDHMVGIAKGPSPDHRRVHARGGDSRLGREVLASLPAPGSVGGHACGLSVAAPAADFLPARPPSQPKSSRPFYSSHPVPTPSTLLGKHRPWEAMESKSWVCKINFSRIWAWEWSTWSSLTSQRTRWPQGPQIRSVKLRRQLFHRPLARKWIRRKTHWLKSFSFLKSQPLGLGVWAASRVFEQPGPQVRAQYSLGHHAQSRRLILPPERHHS